MSSANDTDEGPAAPDERTVFFVIRDGSELGEWSLDELATAARILLAELLAQPDDRERVTNYIAGLTLIDDVPASLVLGKALEIVVTEILGEMVKLNDTTDGSMRGLLAGIADRLRDAQ